MQLKLRPERLAEVIGHDNIKQKLQICIDAANKTGRSLPHMLFQGPPGVGKTTLARVLSKELNRPSEFRELNGATITKPEVLVHALVKAQDGDVIFIDEIQGLSKELAELLFIPLEDQFLLMQKDGIMGSKGIKLPLKNFTLIGATTNIGLVPKPLRERMSIQCFVDYYSPSESANIIRVNMGKLNIRLDEEAIHSLSTKCRGVPRIINNYLQWLQSYAHSKNLMTISLGELDKAMSLYGVDERGLNENDLKYLQVLGRYSHAVGLEKLVAMTGLPKQTIQESIEPHLIQLDEIRLTPNGRILTSKYIDSETDGDDDFSDILNMLKGSSNT